MASINENPVNMRCKAGVRRMKKHNPKTDMTPMVDLGFLLIAFFIITTELSKPVVLKLAMPKDGESTLGNSYALTVLMDSDDKVYYYHGGFTDAIKNNEVLPSNYSVKEGIGKIIRNKQQWLDKSNSKEKRDGLMLLIKATDSSKYENVIDMLDEALINDVKKYALVKPGAGEISWLKNH
jgi:biopolymer transport protein ExbD